MKHIFSKKNLPLFLYYLIVEIAVGIWLFSNAHIYVLLGIIFLLKVMDLYISPTLDGKHSPFSILPFAVLSTFYEWAVPLTLAMPVILFFISISKNRPKIEKTAYMKSFTDLEDPTRKTLFQKIFSRSNTWNIIYLLTLEILMTFYYFLDTDHPRFLLIVLLILAFFTMMEKKGKVTLKGVNGFYILLILADFSQVFAGLAMIYPLADFIYEMAKTE